jgi:uncharacterized protein YndB with AHSA1/START domain
VNRTPAFEEELVIAASPAMVFEALCTLEGLASWWTPAVGGHPGTGGELIFAFDDQRIVMRVDRAEPARLVAWTCIRHTKFPEWDGTAVTFTLGPGDDAHASTGLRFEHAGLVTELDCYPDCSAGWHHYLASLSAHASGGEGMPWRSPAWRPASIPMR